jgi:hypothetical protein
MMIFRFYSKLDDKKAEKTLTFHQFYFVRNITKIYPKKKTLVLMFVFY